MKKLFVLASMLLSISAMATPKVGDYAEFNLTITNTNGSLPGSFSLEITKFDDASKNYTVKTTVQLQGQDAPQVQEDQQAESSFLNDAAIDNVLADCAGAGGTAEQVVVPAGPFNSCKFPQNDDANNTTGFVWIAKSSFGFVKLEQTDNTNHMTQTFELKAAR